MSSIASALKVSDLTTPEIFRCENHCVGVLKHLEPFLTTKQFCDVTLVAGNGQKRVYAHRIILVGASAYFSAMFCGAMRESKEEEVKLHDVTGDALELLVHYCYTGCIELRADTVESVLAAADIFQLNAVVTACCDFLERHLHPTNCLGIAHVAEQRSLGKLLERANILVYENFFEVCQHSEFLQLRSDQLTKLIASDELSAPSEEDIFHIVMKWIEHDTAARQQHFDELLDVVRLPLLQPAFIKESVDPLCTTVKSKQLLVDAVLCRVIPEHKSLRINKRIRSGASDRVLLAVNRDDFKIQCYCPRTNKWTLRDTPVHSANGFRVAVMSDNLIMVGGNSATNTFVNLNFNTRTLTAFKSFSTKRANPFVAVLQGSLYVIGGYDGNHYLNSVERWDPVAQTWSFIKPMQSARAWAAAAVLNECVYVVGGCNECGDDLCSVEIYDPLTQLWKYAANMNVARDSPGVAVVNGLLYAVGGQEGDFSMERYDPNTNTWTLMSTKNTPQFENNWFFSCSTLGNCLIVANKGKYLQEYNTITDAWRELPAHEEIDDVYDLVTISKFVAGQFCQNSDTCASTSGVQMSTGS